MFIEKVNKNKKVLFLLFSTISFILGLLLIFKAPKLAYEFTYDYFAPNGNGSWIESHFKVMHISFFISFVLIGVLLFITSNIYFVNLFYKDTNSK